MPAGATPINNQTIAPGAVYTSAATAITNNHLGVEVQQLQTLTPLNAFGVLVRYKISLDGGSTYGSWRALEHECNGMVAGDATNTAILVNEFADHIIFEATNMSTSSAAFTLSLTQLS